MSNTFTRTFYDNIEHQMYDESTKDTNDYVMNKVAQENSGICYTPEHSVNGITELSKPTNNDGSLNLTDRVVQETLLQNRHLELSSFDRTNKDYAKTTVSKPGNCNIEHMTNADTRLTHPIINYRGMYSANYKFTPYLHMNPQKVLSSNEKYISPNRFGNSTRLDSKNNKDNYKNDLVEFKKLVNGLLPKN